MNVELLKKVKQQILEEPNRLSMHIEITQDEEEFYDVLDGYTKEKVDEPNVALHPPCGTTACIAGWAVILSHPELKPKDVWRNYTISSEAAWLLEITYPQMSKLYYTYNWPVQFREAFKTTDIKKRAEVAAARIDHFIETGE